MLYWKAGNSLEPSSEHPDKKIVGRSRKFVKRWRFGPYLLLFESFSFFLLNVFPACPAQQVNKLMVDAKGRNMKCLTFFLMLPESVKSKSSKGSKKGPSSSSSKLPPVCYEIITLKTKKKKKMAGDIFSTKKTSSASTVQRYQQQNLNNNTIQCCNWQGLYSTIRER